MKIIICGAGKVGTSIAKHLVDQGNEVTVIDQSKQLISQLKEKVDLKTIVGSASYPVSYTHLTLPTILLV